MNPAAPNHRARGIGALAVTVCAFGIGTGAAFADPASHSGNYFAQIAVGTRPDDRAGLRGPNAPSFMAAPAQTAHVRPDDRAGVRGAGVLETASATATTSAASGFHWLDAGIGAGSTFALILTAGGMFLVNGRRRGAAHRSSAASAIHG